MGCSDSAPVAEKKAQPKPPQPLQSLPKKEDNTPRFIIGHISQKQYLFAKVSLTNHSFDRLSIPQQFIPYNFCSMLSLDSKQFIISGGIDFAMKDITNRCYIYDVNTHTTKSISNMIQARYTHTALFVNNQLYVFGGRFYGSDQQAILPSCEVYSLQLNQWNQLPNLNIKRCTCYALCWKSDIYVFGGYTGQFERSEKIQRLNTNNKVWEIMDFELNRGIQSAYVISASNNEVTIFGGNTNSGPTASVTTLNFKEKTVRSHRHLKQPKMLHKGFCFGQQIYIFGGSDGGDLQIYNLAQNKSELQSFKLSQHFSIEAFEGLSHSEQSIIVNYEQSASKIVQSSKEDNIVITFGTTEEPFIFELNVSVPSTEIWSVPLSLKLFAEAGGVHLKDMEFLLFGGIEDDSFSTITSATYLYNHKLRSSQKLANMLMPRYSFAYQKIGNKVYAIGGGNCNPDGNLVFLDSCQYFDIDKKTWNKISNIPVSLTSATALSFNKCLYIFGGLRADKVRNKAIFKYHQNTDSWSQLTFHLPCGIEGASIYPYKPSQFYVFGGRNDNGDSSQIWNLIFTNQESSECAFIEKGKLTQKKNSVKVFKPKNQNFLVCLGGNQDLVSYYDVETLEPMQWDGLKRLKQIFSKELSNLNNTKMKTYLTISMEDS